MRDESGPLLTQVVDKLGQVVDALRSLNDKTDTNTAAIVKLTERMDAVEAGLQVLHVDLVDAQGHLRSVAEKLRSIDEKLRSIDVQLGSIDTRVAALEKVVVGKTLDRLSDVEARLEAIERDRRQH